MCDILRSAKKHGRQQSSAVWLACLKEVVVRTGVGRASPPGSSKGISKNFLTTVGLLALAGEVLCTRAGAWITLNDSLPLNARNLILISAGTNFRMAGWWSGRVCFNAYFGFIQIRPSARYVGRKHIRPTTAGEGRHFQALTRRVGTGRLGNIAGRGAVGHVTAQL